MMKTVRVVVIVLLLLAVAGLILPLLLRTRAEHERVACQNHLREIGLVGVRNAASPGQGLPARPRDELPPGTFLNPSLPPTERMSWYVYLLGVLNEGVPDPNVQTKHRRPVGLTEALAGVDLTAPWNASTNATLAQYRLTTALCPAQLTAVAAGDPSRTNYVAAGGIGLDTPARTPAEAGPNAGAYRYDGPTPDDLFPDGLRQTAQIIETNRDLAPWLQGGPGTLRGLDPAAQPYLGSGRPFGGCHPGGCYMSMADGSVRFVKETIDPVVFRAHMTRAGGPDELNLDSE